MSVQPFVIHAQVPFTAKELVGDSVLVLEIESSDGKFWNAPIISRLPGSGKRRVSFSDGRTATIENDE